MQTLAEEAKTDFKLYKRRWAFLAAMCFIQLVCGWAYSCFGQISNFYVKFFHVSYSLVNWLTMADTLSPLFTAIPLAWLAKKGILGFRNLSISGAVFTVLGFACIAISTSCRSCFAVTFIGQIFNGLSALLVITTPPVLAVAWFPEEQVGTAISVSLVGYFTGNMLGFIVPATALNLDFANTTTLELGRLLEADNRLLMILYTTFTVLTLAVTIFLVVFVTDRPPTPPTEAQRLKTDPNASSQVKQGFWSDIKDIFTNRTVVLAMCVVAAGAQAPVVEFTSMSRVIKDFTRHHDVMGAYAMAAFCAGAVVGSLVVGKVVDIYKRYTVLSLIGTFLAFAFSVGVLLSVHYKSYSWLCAANFLFGATAQSLVVVGFEVLTQETFPLDETMVIVLANGCILPSAVLYGELGDVVFKAWGGVALLAYQSAIFLVTLVLCCFYDTKNKRLAVEKRSTGVNELTKEDTPLLDSCH